MGSSLLLAIHAAACPNQDDPIPQEAMEALNKLFAEVGPGEIKIILGWIFDFRRMLVQLPEKKSLLG